MVDTNNGAVKQNYTDFTPSFTENRVDLRFKMTGDSKSVYYRSTTTGFDGYCSHHESGPNPGWYAFNFEQRKFKNFMTHEVRGHPTSDSAIRHLEGLIYNSRNKT